MDILQIICQDRSYYDNDFQISHFISKSVGDYDNKMVKGGIIDHVDKGFSNSICDWC